MIQKIDVINLRKVRIQSKQNQISGLKKQNKDN